MRRASPHLPAKRPEGRPALRVGLPRGLYYYLWPGLWPAFFRTLGAEVVLSARTSRASVERGSGISESEHCVPNKIFDAHLAELVERVDVLFVPRVLSMLPGHLSCPKLGPLPDMARAGLAGDTEVLTVDIDERKRPLERSLLELGRKTGASRREARRAAGAGLEAMDTWRARRARREARAAARLPGRRMLLVGHPYVVYDDWFAGPVSRALAQLGVAVETVSFAAPQVPRSFILWGVSNRIYHQLHGLDPTVYAGVVMLSTFQCGCDSMMTDPYRDLLRDQGVPLLLLVLDEHTGVAGVQTRLEAFVDSLAWQAETLTA